jgi:hypothetical protein
MNQMLTTIEDDVLDQVSGGGSIVIDPGTAIDQSVGLVTGVVTGVVNGLGDLAKGLAGLFPTLTISWGTRK